MAPTRASSCRQNSRCHSAPTACMEVVGGADCFDCSSPHVLHSCLCCSHIQLNNTYITNTYFCNTVNRSIDGSTARRSTVIVTNERARIVIKSRMTKAGFTLRTQIYGAYADHFAHLVRVFSATNADLRRRDRSGAECKHSYNTPSFTRGCWIVIG